MSFIKKIFCFVLCVIFVFASNTWMVWGAEQERKEDELILYARSAVLMDADTGRILYGKNEKEMLPMASTTKIMTCILALEEGDISSVVEVSDYAASMPKVRLGMRKGEKYRLEDLLYSLMLESHNDTAVAIAEHISGTVEEFAEIMNQKAKEIGCYHTFFITPNGLDAEKTVNGKSMMHSTTAEDLARIMSYCVKFSPEKKEFLKITSATNYSFNDIEGKRSFFCINHNAFLTMMDGVLTGKTGFTGKAGYCYVAALENDKRTFVVALLACGWPNNRSYKWSDAKKMMKYGLEKYKYRNIREEEKDFSLYIDKGIIGCMKKESPYEKQFLKAHVNYDEPEKLFLLLSSDDTIEVKYKIKNNLTAPLAKNTIVGEAEYYINNANIAKYKIISVEYVRKKDLLWTLTYCIRLYLNLL